MNASIIQGLGLGLLLSLAVGPIIFTIIKISLRMGHKAGYAFVTGVSLSDVFLAVLANAAAELMSQLLEHRNIIALCGAVLLLGMGVYSLFFGKDPRPSQTEEELVLNHKKWDVFKYGLQGFLMNTINPGPVFFWITASTSLSYLSYRERMLTFGIALGMVLITDLLKVMLAGRLRNLLTPKILHIIHLIAALILIGFGFSIGIGLLYEVLKG